MDEIILLLDVYVEQNNKLLEYIRKILEDENENEYYRENQEILYIGIVNRVYSLWETFCKDIAYEYYGKIRKQLLAKGELVRKLKLNELPGYIVEEGTICGNKISYEIKKEFITYTSKNIDFDELKKLFLRFDINIDKLKNNRNIKEYINDKSYIFEIDEFDDRSLSKAIKNITDERNMVSHFSAIEQYQELNNIIVWTELCKILARELCNIIIVKIIENIDNSPTKLGTFIKFLTNKCVLCIDVSLGVKSDLESIIYTKRDGKIINVYSPKSFMVNDRIVETINGNDEAGIMLTPLVKNNNTIVKKDDIYIMKKDMYNK